MELKNRIRKILTDKDLNIGGLAEAVGLDKNPLYKMNNGTTKKMSYDSALKINAKWPEYSVSWLTGEEKEATKANVLQEPEEEYNTNSIEGKIAREVDKRLGHRFLSLENKVEDIWDKLSTIQNMLNKDIVGQEIEEEINATKKKMDNRRLSNS